MAGQKESDDAGAMSQGTSLTKMETARITEARQQSTRVRAEPHLPKERSISLLGTGGELEGKSFPIQKAQTLLGRSGGDIEIPDTRVSRNHCVLEVHGTYALLVDLDSVNGTFVNDQKITSCELEHLSEFRIGNTTLMFAVIGQGVNLPKTFST